MKFKIKDKSLSDLGKLRIEWAEIHMPSLRKIRSKFEDAKPLKGLKLGACLHVTKETAVLIRTLVAGGAEVALCGSNPLSTQDDVASALVEDGIWVFAWRGQTQDDYYKCINEVINSHPKIVLDDGADLITTLHTSKKDVLTEVKAGCEETTTGVNRLKAMAKDGTLKFPVIAVNDAYTKYLFDNRYGTGQSTIDGILRATSVLIAGKNFVVVGYGWVGRGIALRARGMGANVIVTEVNPVRALEALMEGFKVMQLKEAAKYGDIFVTATGDINAINLEHIKKMKNGAILANAGHFDVEISKKSLAEISVKVRKIKENVDEYQLKDGRRIYLLAEGRLVNLACAEGHPPEVMDLSFSLQALSTEYLNRKAEKLKPQVYMVPEEIDQKVAQIKLKSMGIKHDKLTSEQKNYLSSYSGGT